MSKNQCKHKYLQSGGGIPRNCIHCDEPEFTLGQKSKTIMSNQSAEEKKWTYKQVPYKSTYKVYDQAGYCHIDVRTETEAKLICDKFNQLDKLKTLNSHCESDHASIEELLVQFNRVGIETFNWDGDEGAEAAIVDGVTNHIIQLQAEKEELRKINKNLRNSLNNIYDILATTNRVNDIDDLA